MTTVEQKIIAIEGEIRQLKEQNSRLKAILAKIPRRIVNDAKRRAGMKTLYLPESVPGWVMNKGRL